MRNIIQYKKTLVCSLFACAALLLTGCKKWVDVNYNPQQLTEASASPDITLADVLVNQASAFSFGSDGYLYFWLGYYAYPFTQPGDVEPSYNITPVADVDGQQGLTIRTLRFIDAKATSTGQTLYAGIAKVMKAKAFAEDVDKYNNIPYRQSGDPLHFPYPQYDDAKFIYEDLIRVLDTAIALIKNADIEKNTSIENADVMFHGDKNKWVKFANTLKLRLLIHQANRPEQAAYIQAEMAKINTEGSGFLGSGEDAAVNPGFTEQNESPLYSAYGFFPGGYESFARDNTMANVIAMNFLKVNHDPRLAYFYTLPVLSLPAGAPEPFAQDSPADYRGNVFGLQIDQGIYPYQNGSYISHIGGRTVHGPVTSASSGILKGYDMDAWILTSVEALFLRAEAIYRGWLTGDAKQAYLDAVQESFRWLNTGGDKNDPSLSDAMFNNWYVAETNAANINVSWDHAPDKYKLLMFQKYLALNGINAKETWTDYRRNGAYPDIPLSASPDRTSQVLPVRLPYPSYEYQFNQANVSAQGTINIFTSKIWWMP
jgi:hypothetical protein